MWRPLNFEIGDTATIENRQKQIDKKLDQAFETCEYLISHPTGTNYNYRNVRRFVPIVVSPFVEWLPGTTERYWISESIPRVMSIDEVLDYFRGIFGVPTLLKSTSDKI